MCRRFSFSTEKALQVNCPPVGSMKALQAIELPGGLCTRSHSSIMLVYVLVYVAEPSSPTRIFAPA